MSSAACRVASARTPLSTSRPESANQSVVGVTPMPTTTTSAGMSEPSMRATPRHPGPGGRLLRFQTGHPDPGAHARHRGRRAGRHRPPPSRSPRTRASGTGRASTTVTRAPRPEQVAATSDPMNPAPTTTSLVAGRETAAARAKQSSRVRNVCTPREMGGVGQGAGVGPGGHHGPVERQPVAVVELEGVSGHVESGGACARGGDRDRGRRSSPGRADGRGRDPRYRPATAWTAGGGHRARGSRPRS